MLNDIPVSHAYNEKLQYYERKKIIGRQKSDYSLGPSISQLSASKCNAKIRRNTRTVIDFHFLS